MSQRDRQVLELLQRSGPRLHALLLRLTLREDVAEDLMQELFLRLASSRNFHVANNADAYAVTTAVHLAMDWRRSPKALASPIDFDQLAAGGRSPVATLIEWEELEQMLQAMERLKPHDCEILAQHYLDGRDYVEIAASRGTSAHAERARCAKALARLRQIVRDPAAKRGGA